MVINIHVRLWGFCWHACLSSKRGTESYHSHVVCNCDGCVGCESIREWVCSADGGGFPGSRKMVTFLCVSTKRKSLALQRVVVFLLSLFKSF